MNTKAHIMRESLKLFLRKSFKEVTLNEILKKTNLSKGAFYYYYESKEQLFLEIVENYFSYTVIYNFDRYSKNSLKDFYEDHLKDLEKAIGRFSSDKARMGSATAMNANYFYPMFDASRILPEFMVKLREARRQEVFYWSQSVERARKSGEIVSRMSDEQIAKIFIYTGNSIGLQLIMEDGPVSSFVSSYREFWDNFYESLKA